MKWMMRELYNLFYRMERRGQPGLYAQDITAVFMAVTRGQKAPTDWSISIFIGELARK